MQSEYIERGETIYYTPEDAVAAGSVLVLGDRIAVAASDAKAGFEAVAHVVGVFSMPKGEEAIEQGKTLYWDGDKVSTTEGGTPAGYAWAAATAAEQHVAVKLPG